MGARGPKPKLPQLERLDGNPSKRPILGEFLEANGLPFVPDHLPEDAAGCMDVVMASMPERVFSQADTFTLAAFAMAWAAHKRAAHEIASPGFQWVVESDATGMQRPNPWLGILNDQASKMAMLGDRLGLNPKARVGIKLPSERPASRFGTLLEPRKSSTSFVNSPSRAA